MKEIAQISKPDEDLKYTLQFIQPVLSIVGAWPIPSTSLSIFKLLQWILISVSYFLLLVTLIPCILYIILKARNGRTQLKLLAPAVTGIIQLIKYTTLLYRQGEFQKVLEDMRKDWLSATKENRLIYREKAKIAHRLMLLVAITMYSGGVGYRVVLPLLRKKMILPNNVTLRLLPCPGYFLFINEQLTPNYEIIFVLQVLAGLTSYTLLTGTTGVLAMLCLHTVSSLRILANKMIKLNNETNISEENVQRKIAEIVNYQEKIKRFLNNVEQITHHLCFFEMVNDTLIGCIVGYCLIAEWENSNATAIVVFTTLQITCVISTFTICYIGQLLLDESDIVRQTTITMDWYRFPVRNAKCLIIMIIKNNHPINLKAAKVITVSLATFTDILKLSMTYLNMFREVT